MSDLIDRQAAIEYIKMQKWRRFEGMTIEDAILTMIREVPPAQPYTDKELQKIQDLEQAQFDKMYEMGYQAGRSAQPEIIYCKDCMYTDGDKPIADGRYWCMLHGTFMYYCSDAERGSDETNRRRQATGR